VVSQTTILVLRPFYMKTSSFRNEKLDMKDNLQLCPNGMPMDEDPLSRHIRSPRKKFHLSYRQQAMFS